MKECPFCAEEIQEAAIYCKHCHRDLIPRPANEAPPLSTAPAPAHIGATGAARFFYAVTVLSALLGGGFFCLLWLSANSAPQEAAAAAMACAVSVVPYVIARALDSMDR